jgi:hypothetical protein
VRSLEMYEKVRKNVFIWFLEYAGTEQPLHGQDVASIIQRRGKTFYQKHFNLAYFSLSICKQSVNTEQFSCGPVLSAKELSSRLRESRHALDDRCVSRQNIYREFSIM